MFNSILVICTGNICRSPFAERILRKKLPNMKIDSAGTGALVDSAADSTAMRIAKSFDVSLDGHKGKQFSAKLGREYDLILVMEKAHITQISSIAPEVRGKTMLLNHWVNQKDITDPYRKSDEAFESVFNLIEKACLKWVEKLNG